MTFRVRLDHTSRPETASPARQLSSDLLVSYPNTLMRFVLLSFAVLSMPVRTGLFWSNYSTNWG